mmetsp:Transcript_24926/g.30002  ORF Transcript_24926/g.30002 Transcript_24926/m.30002 type:complete len:122 (-) Transcript_24926:852-1217(-)
MRLVTHNMLRSNVKGATNGYPLGLEATQVVTEESEYSSEMLERLLCRVDYSVLYNAAASVNIELPTSAPNDRNDDFLRKAHHALLEVHIVEGTLICPDTGRRFPIQNGIPNMLLHEDELGD